MQLFKLKKEALSPLAKEPFQLEKDIQNLIESNLRDLFDLEFVASEFSIGNFRLDTLAYDEQSNAFVVIEYKKGSSYSVIDQGYSYLSTMLNNKAEFILEFNERMDTNLKRSEVDWTSSRILFVSPSFNNYQKNSVNFKDVPFELWEIRKFEGGLIALEQHQAASNESINALSNGKAHSVISKVSAEVKQVSEEQMVAKLSESLHPVWQTFRERLSDYPDTVFYTTRKYVGFKKDSKVVAFITLQKNQIRVDVLRGSKSKEGELSKGFFHLDDPKGLAEERDWTWKSGATGHEYRIGLKDLDDLDYVMYLLNQKYESI